MATSGSVDFSVSRDNLIEDAIRIVGGLGPEDSASTAQKTHGARILNMIGKAWQGYGIGLWARKTGYVLPQSGYAIDLGPSGDHATLAYIHTTLSSAASGSTAVVASATGISASDFIGIEMSDGTMHWTTVNGAPSGTTITLTSALTSAASSGADVYTYTTKLQRPIKVLDAYWKQSSDLTETPLVVLAKAEFESLSQKDEMGVVTQVTYDPQLVDGTLYINPQFENGDRVIKIIFQRPFEDFDAAADTPDFPQEWYLALMYALAVVLAPTYGLPVMDRKALQGEAQQALALALANEPEEGSLKIMPNDA